MSGSALAQATSGVTYVFCFRVRGERVEGYVRAMCVTIRAHGPCLYATPSPHHTVFTTLLHLTAHRAHHTAHRAHLTAHRCTGSKKQCRSIHTYCGIDGGDASLAPTGLRAMGRNELQWLCKQKGFKANVSNKSMSAALQASMCSDMTATGGGCAADDGGDGMILDFKSLTCEELKLLRKQKPRANDTSVNMANALEAFRCSAVAAVADGSAAEDDDEDVEDDED